MKSGIWTNFLACSGSLMEAFRRAKTASVTWDGQVRGGPCSLARARAGFLTDGTLFRSDRPRRIDPRCGPVRSWSLSTSQALACGLAVDELVLTDVSRGGRRTT